MRRKSCTSSDLPSFLQCAILVFQTIIPLLIRFRKRGFKTSVDPLLKHENEPSADEFNPASITLAAEIIKLMISFLILVAVHAQGQKENLLQAAIKTLGRQWGALVRFRNLFLPATAYFASNVTAILALGYLRSYIFSAIMNTRIVFGAILSVILLRKSTTGQQWKGIAVIVCAVTLLCLEDMKISGTEKSHPIVDDGIGILFAICTALLSATGGVLMQKHLTIANQAVVALVLGTDGNTTKPQAQDKTETGLLWQQQSALACFSLVFAVLYIVLFDQIVLIPEFWFRGWDGIIFAVAVLQACQGILVALAIQRYGIVCRLILGALSICLCVALEFFLFWEPVQFQESLAIILTIVGSSIYVAETHTK